MRLLRMIVEFLVSVGGRFCSTSGWMPIPSCNEIAAQLFADFEVHVYVIVNNSMGGK